MVGSKVPTECQIFDIRKSVFALTSDTKHFMGYVILARFGGDYSLVGVSLLLLGIAGLALCAPTLFKRGSRILRDGVAGAEVTVEAGVTCCRDGVRVGFFLSFSLSLSARLEVPGRSRPSIPGNSSSSRSFRFLPLFSFSSALGLGSTWVTRRGNARARPIIWMGDNEHVSNDILTGANYANLAAGDGCRWWYIQR
jgi:hypothetical protein